MDGKDERRLVLMWLELAGDFGLNGELRLLHLDWLAGARLATLVFAVKVKHLYLSSLHIQLTLIPLVYSLSLSHFNGHYRKG